MDSSPPEAPARLHPSLAREYQLDFTEGGRSIAIQTMYRDGDAQTVPYEPELAPLPSRGAPPEVAKLSFLRFGGPPGASLPAALQDVRAVEAARERARIEAALPPMTDEASFELRKVLMEAVELAALRQREADLDARNASAVALIDQAVAARAAEREFVADQRVEALRRSLEAEKEAALAAITSRRIRTMRKLSRSAATGAAHLDMLCGTGPSAAAAAVAVLTAGASSLGRKRAGRDIIAEYANPASRVYAQPLHAGLPKHPAKGGAPPLTAVAGAPLALARGRGGGIPELSTPGALAAFLATTLPAEQATLLPLGTLLGGGSGIRAVAGGASAAAASLRSAPLGTLTLPRAVLLHGAAAAPAPAAAAAGSGGGGGNRAADASSALVADLERVYAKIQTEKAGLSTSALLNATLPAWRAPKAREDRPPTPLLAGAGEGGEGEGGTTLGTTSLGAGAAAGQASPPGRSGTGSTLEDFSLEGMGLGSGAGSGAAAGSAWVAVHARAGLVVVTHCWC